VLHVLSDRNGAFPERSRGPPARRCRGRLIKNEEIETLLPGKTHAGGHLQMAEFRAEVCRSIALPQRLDAP
jgi:hypothetical protein